MLCLRNLILMARRRYDQLCFDITTMAPEVIGCWILENGEPIGSYTKPKSPIPNGKRLKIIFIQAAVMAGMPSIHEDLYGRFRAIIIKHKAIDAIIMPFEDGSKVVTI